MEIITNRIGIPGAVESLIGGRNENQDDFGFAETALGMLVVVCDGMGGGPAGRTASGLACETIIRQLKTAKMNDDPETVLYNAVIAATMRCSEQSRQNRICRVWAPHVYVFW